MEFLDFKEQTMAEEKGILWWQKLISWELIVGAIYSSFIAGGIYMGMVERAKATDAKVEVATAQVVAIGPVVTQMRSDLAVMSTTQKNLEAKTDSIEKKMDRRNEVLDEKFAELTKLIIERTDNKQ